MLYVDCIANSMLKKFANDASARTILNLMDTYKHHNLRSLIFACQKSVDIMESLNAPYGEDFVESIFFGIICFRSMSCRSRRMVDFASLPGAMSVSHRSMYFASVSCWAGCGVWRQSRSKRTACSLSHFSTCLGVSSSGGWTVFCWGLMRLPL